MTRILMIVVALTALTALSACQNWQNVGGLGSGMVCNKKGEGVLWAKPNSQGKMNTLNLSKENCYK